MQTTIPSTLTCFSSAWLQRCLLLAMMVASLSVQAGSLDEAVSAQLENGCARLLAAGSSPVGALADICNRPPVVGGGSGGTPVTGAEASGGGSVAPSVTALNGTYRTQATTEQLAPNWSAFFTYQYESSDRSASPQEGAFASSLDRLQTGITYRASKIANYSLALNHSEQDGSFTAGGDFQTISTGLLAVASFQLADPFSLDLVAAQNWISADRTRFVRFDDLLNQNVVYTATGTPVADYGYHQSGLTAQGNYQWHSGGLSLQALLGLDWVHTHYGTYSEHNGSGLGLTFYNDALTSLQSRTGVLGRYVISTSHGVFVPQAGITWNHEFRQNGRSIDVSFVDDLNAVRFQYQAENPDSDYFNLNLACVWVLPKGLQAFASVEKPVQLRYYDNLIASIGIRQEF